VFDLKGVGCEVFDLKPISGYPKLSERACTNPRLDTLV
jgi:hypothetical protein